MTGFIRSLATLALIGLAFATLTSGTLRADDSQAAPTAGPSTSVPTHEQIKSLAPTDGDAHWKLVSFCITRDGRIAAVLDRQESTPSLNSSIASAMIALLGRGDSRNNADAAKSSQSPAELRILDADGQILNKYPLDFEAQAINLGPDGSMYLGGDGVVLHLDAAGHELQRAESPQLAAGKQDPEALKARARETLEEQRASIEQNLKSFREQKELLEKKPDSELTDDERQTKTQLDSIIAAYSRSAERSSKPITDQEIAQTAAAIAQQDRHINAIAANDKFVFTTTRASKGYGYRVWRTKLDFSEPTTIVDGLSGCCGQMDVQCCGDDIVVAENSRKRVVRYDANGKQVDSWGKASRDGEGDTFGSCCNPMNTRFAAGKLYVSDSDGRVRLFTVNGTYEGEVGKAGVQPGCKSSIVDLAPDASRVYYIDVQNSKICVLERKPDPRQAAR